MKIQKHSIEGMNTAITFSATFRQIIAWDRVRHNTLNESIPSDDTRYIRMEYDPNLVVWRGDILLHFIGDRQLYTIIYGFAGTELRNINYNITALWRQVQ